MKSLISINNKFMSITPKRLVELILESEYTKGVEAYINVEDRKEVKYLEDLVFELKKNNLILQIHGDINLDIQKQISYVKLIEKYSDYLGYPIIFTIHTVYNDDKEISLNNSVEYLTALVNNINNDKVVISLENLNDSRKKDRLNKEDIKNMILNDEKIYFTYDIGHELIDFGDITNLDEYMIEDIRNIHLHSNDNKGNNHLPIYKHDIHWNEIMKGLTFLIVNKYQYNIVYEYDLNNCKGNTIEEKIKDFLESIDFVSEKYINA